MLGPMCKGNPMLQQVLHSIRMAFYQFVLLEVYVTSLYMVLLKIPLCCQVRQHICVRLCRKTERLQSTGVILVVSWELPWYHVFTLAPQWLPQSRYLFPCSPFLSFPYPVPSCFPPPFPSSSPSLFFGPPFSLVPTQSSQFSQEILFLLIWGSKNVSLRVLLVPQLLCGCGLWVAYPLFYI